MHTGLLFGSFNPIHIGHVIIASYMTEFEGLDEVWLVVSPQNPLKKKSELMDDRHRYEMCRRVLEKYPMLKTSDIEFSMPLPSYTIDTLKKLEEEHPAHTFSVIMGSDNIEKIDKWKEFKKITTDFSFYFYPRPGTSNEKISLFRNARMVKAPLIEISSTFIRDAASKGKNIRPYLPEEAYNYISSNKIELGGAPDHLY